MAFLTDLQLRLKLSQNKLIAGINSADIDSEVYGCAVYLHIGDVFLPGQLGGFLGSAENPLKHTHVLAEGETALVRTVETFVLDENHAALVLPSSGVSMQGLLMTNPGHVDPGYSGQIHVTVINMGQKPFALVPGSRFLRALVFRLDGQVIAPFVNQGKSPVTRELLARLAPDFLSVDARTKAAAKKEIDAAIRGNTIWQYTAPALFAVIGAVLGNVFSTHQLSSNFEERIKALQAANAEKRLAELEYKVPTTEKLQQFEMKLDRIERSLKK